MAGRIWRAALLTAGLWTGVAAAAEDDESWSEALPDDLLEAAAAEGEVQETAGGTARASQVTADAVTPLLLFGLNPKYVRVEGSSAAAEEAHVRRASCDAVTPQEPDDFLVFSGFCLADDVFAPPLSGFGLAPDGRSFVCRWSGRVSAARAIAMCVGARSGQGR